MDNDDLNLKVLQLLQSLSVQVGKSIYHQERKMGKVWTLCLLLWLSKHGEVSGMKLLV